MDPVYFNYLRSGAILYIVLVGSVCIHEWAHAFAADKRGDLLPFHQGRVTLNPLAHMDMLGTVVFPLLMIFGPILFGGSMGIALLGWGKPVEISLANPRTRKLDDIIITAAGPLSNLLIAFTASVIGFFVVGRISGSIEIIEIVIGINVALFVFNLIPIPPLDGSRLLRYLIGMGEETYLRLSQYGFIILLILINVGPFRSFLSYAINIATIPFDNIILLGLKALH